jgi:hypothetical protein
LHLMRLTEACSLFQRTYTSKKDLHLGGQ